MRHVLAPPPSGDKPVRQELERIQRALPGGASLAVWSKRKQTELRKPGFQLKKLLSLSIDTFSIKEPPLR